MYAIALIAFRETLEMFLILVPLIAYLSKLNRGDLAKYIYWGSLTGLVSSVVIGAMLYGQAEKLAGYSRNLFEGSIMLIVAGLIVYNLVIMGSSKTKSIANIEQDYNVSVNAFSLFILAFLTIFRECLEIIMFGLPMFDIGAVKIGIGLLIGVLVTCAITIVIYKTTINFNINLLFSLITLLLIFIGAHMFGEGIAELMATEDEVIVYAGTLVYAIPCLYFFLKSVTRKYIKKK